MGYKILEDINPLPSGGGFHFVEPLTEGVAPEQPVEFTDAMEAESEVRKKAIELAKKGRLASGVASFAKSAVENISDTVAGIPRALKTLGPDNPLDLINPQAALASKVVKIITGKNPINEELARERDLAGSPVTVQAEAMAEGGKEAFKPNPMYKGEWLADKIPSILGSTFPALAATALGGPATGIATYALASGQQGAKEALEAGKPEEADKAFLGYALAGGVSEATLGVMPNLLKIVRSAREAGISPQTFAQALLALTKTAGKSAGKEIPQEGLEQGLQNFVAQQSFDPNRKLTEGVGEAAIGGGIVGALVGGGAHVVGQAAGVEQRHRNYAKAVQGLSRYKNNPERVQALRDAAAQQSLVNQIMRVGEDPNYVNPNVRQTDTAVIIPAGEKPAPPPLPPVEEAPVPVAAQPEDQPQMPDNATVAALSELRKTYPEDTIRKAFENYVVSYGWDKPPKDSVKGTMFALFAKNFLKGDERALKAFSSALGPIQEQPAQPEPAPISPQPVQLAPEQVQSIQQQMLETMSGRSMTITKEQFTDPKNAHLANDLQIVNRMAGVRGSASVPTDLTWQDLANAGVVTATETKDGYEIRPVAKGGEQRNEETQRQEGLQVTPEQPAATGKEALQVQTPPVAPTPSVNFEVTSPPQAGKKPIVAKGTWDIIDASEIGYGKGVTSLQERNRKSAASQQQIADMAARLDPRYLGESATALDGAPIIDSNGERIAGYGRLEAIRTAYESESPASQGYRQFVTGMAQQLGIPDKLQGKANPVLVRRVSEYDGGTREQFAADSNKSQALEFTPAELALSDAKVIVENNLMAGFSITEDGTINRSFLDGFFQNAKAKDGLKTSDGKQYLPAMETRVKVAILTALLAKSSKNPELLIRRVVEQAGELGLKKVVTGLTQAAGRLMAIEDLNPAFSLSVHVSVALEEFIEVKKQKDAGYISSLQDYLSQQSLFAGDRTAESDILLEQFYTAKSAKALVEMLSEYARKAEAIVKDSATMDMFGNLPQATVLSVLKGTLSNGQIATQQSLGEATGRQAQPANPGTGVPGQQPAQGQAQASPDESRPGTTWQQRVDEKEIEDEIDYVPFDVRKSSKKRQVVFNELMQEQQQKYGFKELNDYARELIEELTENPEYRAFWESKAPVDIKKYAQVYIESRVRYGNNISAFADELADKALAMNPEIGQLLTLANQKPQERDIHFISDKLQEAGYEYPAEVVNDWGNYRREVFEKHPELAYFIDVTKQAQGYEPPEVRLEKGKKFRESTHEGQGVAMRNSAYDDVLNQYPLTPEMVLTAIAERSKHPWMRGVAQHLLPLKQNVRIRFMNRQAANLEYGQSWRPDTQGVHSPGINTILVFHHASEPDITILHELVHNATDDRLKNPEYAAYQQEVEAMLAEARAAVHGKPEAKYFDYALSDRFEFVAEAFSDPMFQQWLDKQPTKQGMSLWQKFLNFVRRIIGLPEQYASIMNQLVRAVEPNMATPPQSQMKRTVFQAGNATITAPGVTMQEMKAYHGTPHVVDKFDMSKIGTGEGAQVYGWGLYFAQNKEVAESYKVRLGGATAQSGVAWKNLIETLKQHEPDMLGFDSWREAANALAAEPNYRQTWGDLQPQTIAAVDAYRDARGGLVYTVELDAEPEQLLDWDKPINQQSKTVKDAVAKVLGEPYANGSLYNGSFIYNKLTTQLGSREASRVLADAGLKGIQYLDQGSRVAGADKHGVRWDSTGTKAEVFNRSTGDVVGVFNTFKEADAKVAELAGSQTRNYVVFDENIIRITHQNGQQITPTEAMATDWQQRVQAPPTPKVAEANLKESTAAGADQAQYERNALNAQTGDLLNILERQVLTTADPALELVGYNNLLGIQGVTGTARMTYGQIVAANPDAGYRGVLAQEARLKLAMVQDKWKKLRARLLEQQSLVFGDTFGNKVARKNEVDEKRDEIKEQWQKDRERLIEQQQLAFKQTFTEKLSQLTERDVKRDSIRKMWGNHQAKIRDTIGEARKALKKIGRNEAQTQMLLKQISSLESVDGYYAAIEQAIGDMVNVVANASPMAVQFAIAEQPDIAAFLAEYNRVKNAMVAAGTSMPANDDIVIQWAGEIVGDNWAEMQRMVLLTLAKKNMELQKSVTAFETEVIQGLRQLKEDITNREKEYEKATRSQDMDALRTLRSKSRKTVSEVIRTARKNSRADALTTAAWQKLRKDITRELDELELLQNAVGIVDKAEADPEFTAFYNTVLKDSGQEARPDVVVMADGEAVNLGELNYSTIRGNPIIPMPDGTFFRIRITGNKTEFEAERRKMVAARDKLLDWKLAQDALPEAQRSTQYQYFTRWLDVVTNLYLSSRVVHPGSLDTVVNIFTGEELGGWELLAPYLDHIATRVGGLAKVPCALFTRKNKLASELYLHASDLANAYSDAVNSYDEHGPGFKGGAKRFAKGITDPKLRHEKEQALWDNVLQPLSVEAQHPGFVLRAGMVVGEGYKVTPEVVAYLKLECSVTRKAYDIVKKKVPGERPGLAFPEVIRDVVHGVVLHGEAIAHNETTLPFNGYTKEALEFTGDYLRRVQEQPTAAADLMEYQWRMIFYHMKDQVGAAVESPFHYAYIRLVEMIRDGTLTPMAHERSLTWVATQLAPMTGLTVDEVKAQMVQELDTQIRKFEEVANTDREPDTSSTVTSDVKSSFTAKRHNRELSAFFVEYGWRSTGDFINFVGNVHLNSLNELDIALGDVEKDLHRQRDELAKDYTARRQAAERAGLSPMAAKRKAVDESYKANDLDRMNGQTLDKYRSIKKRLRVLNNLKLDLRKNYGGGNKEAEIQLAISRKIVGVATGSVLTAPSSVINNLAAMSTLGATMAMMSKNSMRVIPKVMLKIAWNTLTRTIPILTLRPTAWLGKKLTGDNPVSNFVEELLEKIDNYKVWEGKGIIPKQNIPGDYEAQMRHLATDGAISSDDRNQSMSGRIGMTLLSLYKANALTLATKSLLPRFGDFGNNLTNTDMAEGVIREHEDRLRELYSDWEDAGTLDTRFNWNDPSDPMNIITAEELFPSYLFKEFQKAKMEYLRQMSDWGAITFDNAAFRFLRDLKMGKTDAKLFYDYEMDTWVEKSLSTVNIGDATNRPFWTRDKKLLNQLTAPLMGYPTHSTYQVLRFISVATRGDDRRVLVWLMLLAGLLPMLFLALNSTSISVDYMKRWVGMAFGKEPANRMPWERDGLKSQAIGWLISTANPIPFLGMAVSGMVNDMPTRASLDITPMVINKVKDIAGYFGGVIQTGDPTYGLDRMVASMIPVLDPILAMTDYREGYNEALSARRIMQRHGETDMLRPMSHSTVGLATPLTPFGHKMLNAAMRGDEAEFQSLYNEALDVAKDMGKENPSESVRQLFLNQNPYDRAFKQRLSGTQRQTLLGKMSERERGIVQDVEQKFERAASLMGATARFEKVSGGMGGGGSSGGAGASGSFVTPAQPPRFSNRMGRIGRTRRGIGRLSRVRRGIGRLRRGSGRLSRRVGVSRSTRRLR